MFGGQWTKEEIAAHRKASADRANQFKDTPIGQLTVAQFRGLMVSILETHEIRERDRSCGRQPAPWPWEY